MTTAWPATCEVTSPEAIGLLTDLRGLRYLMPFMRSEHTLSTAAAALGRAPSTLAYWIPRFERARLLVRLGAHRRAGMAMPRYRAAAQQFTVRLASVPLDRRVALLDEGRLRVMRRFLDGIDEALQADRTVALGFSSTSEGTTAIQMVEPQPRPRRSFTDGWIMLRLDAEAAQELAAELEALTVRYGGQSRGKQYIVHVGVAPEPRTRWRSATDQLP